MDDLQFELNPALDTVGDHKALWNSPDFRRWGFHNLHNNARYSLNLRSDCVLALEKCFDRRIGDMDADYSSEIIAMLQSISELDYDDE